MGHVHRFVGLSRLSHMDAAATLDRQASNRPWKRGLAWLALLGPFFFLSYGLANWITGLSAGHASIVFDWEQAIPFLAWTIIPYWSIDLLYGLSLVLFATREALDRHAWRLLVAQLIAVACFIAFPLRFAFTRPPVDGISAWLFAALDQFDQPFNQAPSLHLALLVILWSAYAHWIGSIWRPLMHAFFLLIGVSALTTWQHHFVDIPTGVWLGAFCVWLFPADMRSPFAGTTLTRDPVRLRLALRYALGALAAAAAGVGGGGAWMWLSWGSGSLGLVAAIYAFGHATSFQKRADGSMSAAALWLLWPYLLGAALNAKWWTRASALADPVAAGIYVGRMPNARELGVCGVAGIVDVCAELPCRPGEWPYASVPMLDLVAPTSGQIERACREIESKRAAGPVLVCCALGFSRSALVAAAWLVHARLAATIDAAVAQVRRARPQAVFDEKHLAALREWHERHARRSLEGERP